MFKQPLDKYRPTKTTDGEGGFTDALGTATTIYGSIEIHKETTSLVVDKDEDVIVGDFIKVAEESTMTEALYRVMDSIYTHGQRLRRLTLQRSTRPIVP